VYILSAQLEENPDTAFERYRLYLKQVWERLPPGAREFIEADWYFDSRDHRCPHDAWLEEARIFEPHSGARKENRHAAIQVRLLGAYHDGHIELSYREVSSYSFAVQRAGRGHRDWLHDEIRSGADGGVIHEIEWCGSQETGRWLIQAADVEYRWVPLHHAG
jgi:hypothetical protein